MVTPHDNPEILKEWKDYIKQKTDRSFWAACKEIAFNYNVSPMTAYRYLTPGKMEADREYSRQYKRNPKNKEKIRQRDRIKKKRKYWANESIRKQKQEYLKAYKKTVYRLPQIVAKVIKKDEVVNLETLCERLGEETGIKFTPRKISNEIRNPMYHSLPLIEVYDQHYKLNLKK